MKLKINYFGIGLFIIGAFALVLAGVIFWGADSFSRNKYFIETYFDETVQGLNIGSPVYYRGVKIGEVHDIAFAVMNYPEISQASKFSKYIQVTISMTQERSGARKHPPITILRRLIEEGLRLRLVTQPLTGIAYVEADYVDPELYPELEIAWEPASTYIPSAPSLLSKLTQTAENAFKRLSEMDINALLNKADQLLTNLNQVVVDAQIKTVSDEVIKTVKDFGLLSSQTRQYLSPDDSSQPKTTLDDVLGALTDLIGTLESEVQKIQFEKVSEELIVLLKELQQTNDKIQALAMSSPDKPQATVEDVLTSIESTSDNVGHMAQRMEPEIVNLINSLVRTTNELKTLINDLQEHPSRTIFSGPPAPTEIEP